MVVEPIIKKINDKEKYLKNLENNFDNNEEEKNIIMNYPIVYIHNWESGQAEYEVYVGESNDIIKRTKEHYEKLNDKNSWQKNLKKSNSKLYIIGHEHFNKSLTLDVENKLIQYLLAVDKIKKVYNRKSNPQNEYYPKEEFEEIFDKIWRKLKEDNKELFPDKNEIIDKAIFKASPFHKLTNEQEEAKKKIVNKIIKDIDKEERGQIIFIEGEAGSGKSVLNSSTFYETISIFDKINKEKNKKLSCYLLVNHEEQYNVYNGIMNKLGVNEKYGQVVYKPTPFLNRYTGKKVDVVFIDEAHLLLTQGYMGYTGKNHLEDIRKIAKVVVMMFDKNQILRANQYIDIDKINKIKEESECINLKNQLRIQANEDVIRWIDKFTKESIIEKLPEDMGNYEIKSFDTPEELEKEIKLKAQNKETKLSRMVATYDWKYNKKESKGHEYMVKIGQWQKLWNYQLINKENSKEKKNLNKLSWAEQDITIDEIGSIYTIQGFDLNYVGVILGDSIKYDEKKNKIIYEPIKKINTKATDERTLENGEKKSFSKDFKKNEVRVLMTRGVNGLYIYACDEALRNKLRECCKKEDICELLNVAENKEIYK